MKTTKEKIEVMQAFEDGKTIQSSRQGLDEWMDYSNVINRPPIWDWVCFDYRIKPEPKLRPWKPEEVPLDCILKCGEIAAYRYKIASLNETAIFIVNGCGNINEIKLYELKQFYFHSLDHGKTWLPCGVEE